MRELLLLLGLSGLFLGWNAPNHYPPWATSHLEFFAAAGLCLLALAVFGGPLLAAQVHHPSGATSASAALRVPMPTAAHGWILLTFWPVLQYLVGDLPFRGDAFIALLYGLGVALSLSVGRLWAMQTGSDRVLRTIWLTIVVGGLASNGLAIVHWLRLDPPGPWAMQLIDDRPFANFAQPNHFGLLMVMSVIAVTSLFEMVAIQRRWIYGLAVAFFSWGVIISESRGSALALALVAAFWLLSLKRVNSRLRVRDMLFLATVYLALNTAAAPAQELLLLKTSELRALTDLSTRELIWRHFWTAIVERPWWGYGFNQSVQALAHVAEQVQPSRNTVFAHNLVLDLMVWFGIPLALMAMAALCHWMLGWLGRNPDLSRASHRHAVFSIWLALLTQSMLEFPYAHTYFLLPAALLAGAATAVFKEAEPTCSRMPVSASRPTLAIAVATAALLVVVGWEYFQMEADFRLNRFDRANFSNQEQPALSQKPWVLDQLAALNASARIRVAPGMPKQQIQELHVLSRRFHVISLRIDYARALALNGQLAQAEHEMKIVRSVSPPATYARLEREWRSWLQANLKTNGPDDPLRRRP